MERCKVPLGRRAPTKGPERAPTQTFVTIINFQLSSRSSTFITIITIQLLVVPPPLLPLEQNQPLEHWSCPKSCPLLHWAWNLFSPSFKKAIFYHCFQSDFLIICLHFLWYFLEKFVTRRNNFEEGVAARWELASQCPTARGKIFSRHISIARHSKINF